MFGFFKSQKTSQTEDLPSLLKAAIEEVKHKWIHFDQTIHLKPEFRLANKIEMFADPVQSFLQSKYPMLLLEKPGKVIWLTIFTAIAESKTYPQELVNEAVAELTIKYGMTTT